MNLVIILFVAGLAYMTWSYVSTGGFYIYEHKKGNFYSGDGYISGDAGGNSGGDGCGDGGGGDC